MPFESDVVALAPQQLASGGRPVPRVTSGSQKTGCANHLRRPFPVWEPMPRTTWVQGFSHCATKIKVDAEHTAHMPAPSSSCRCRIGGNAQKSPGQMRHRGLPPPAEDDPRRTRGTEASGAGEQRHAGPRLPGPREGCLQLRIRRYRHRCPAGGTLDRGVQGHSPLARDVDPAALGGG